MSGSSSASGSRKDVSGSSSASGSRKDVSGSSSASGSRSARTRRLDPRAIGGVLYRERVVFTRYWRSTTFSAVVEPTIFLLAFGFGIGVMVAEVAGMSYLDFVGTGVVAMAVLFASVFPAMFGTYVKRRYQHTYDGLLAAPIDVEELVTAEGVWIGLRSGIYGLAPLGVAVAFGLRPGIGVVAVPLVGIATGLGFAWLGIAISAVVPSIDSFGYIISAVVTPLFLLAGTFFPLENLPDWIAVGARANPLYHCVELVRGAVFGFSGPGDLWHVLALVVFALLTWVLATVGMRRALID